MLNKLRFMSVFAAAAVLVPMAACAPPSSNGGGTEDDGKFLIYNNLSYSGNAWSNAAANMMEAVANTAPYDDKVEFRKVISGADVSKQISDLQSMINNGADAIISYPLSPKALNAVVDQAAEKGTLMFFYDGTVTNEKAYNVSYITAGFGQHTAQALVNELGGEGKILMNSGVSGTGTDTMHNESAMSVFEKYPGIEVVSQYWSNWDAVQSKTNTLRALAAHPDIDGVWSQDGEYGVVQALRESGRPLVPVTGEMSNGFRNQLISLEDDGLTGVSSGSGPTVGAYAFKLAMGLLTGELDEADVPHNVEFPLPWVPADEVELGDPSDPGAGGNAWPLDEVPPIFAAGIYYPDLVPEINYASAIDGTPAPGAEIQPIDTEDIVEAPAVPEINSSTTEFPGGLYDVNPEIVEPIPVP
ncbi:MAG: sugar ABC transporter substrate-binding protein [Nocardioides sp.]|nr:sugar ABC transporter substrate-binding protein [Nocardioides sp.]